MSGFNAAAVETLDFDFTGIVGSDGVALTEKGIVSEPSDVLLADYFTANQSFQKEALALLEAGVEDEKDGVTHIAELREAVKAVCNGTPSDAELDRLPPRYLAAFNRWLTETFGGGSPKG